MPGARRRTPCTAVAVDHADTELIGHRGWEATGFLCAGKQPHNGCFLLAEGSSGSPSCSTGDSKANPVTSLASPLGGKGTGFVGSRKTTENPVTRFPPGRRGPRSGAGVYYAASRKDTLCKPECQTAAFPPTGIY